MGNNTSKSSAKEKNKKQSSSSSSIKLNDSSKGEKKKKKVGNEKTSKTRKEYYIFVFGIQGAGKSTFAKQASIIFSDGFTIEQQLNMKPILLSNTVMGMKEVINEMEKKEFSCFLSSNMKKMRFIKELDVGEVENVKMWKNNVMDLWEDKNVQNCWKSMNTPQTTFLDYHVKKLENYCDPGYLPSNEDMLRARQRTTGQLNTEIVVRKTLWKITDVGGQKSERDKWDQIIKEKTSFLEGEMIKNENEEKNTKVILFFASLIDFDSFTQEDGTKSNLKHTESVFENVVQYSSEKNGGFIIILCLNKIDLFEEKLKNPESYSRFKKEFPDYKEKGDDIISCALKFIQERFKTIAYNVNEKTELAIFVTCGLDTGIIKKTFDGISDALFAQNMQSKGLNIM